MLTKFNTAPKLPQPKVGVFFNKDKKILELEEENQQMEDVLKQLLSQHNTNAQIFKGIERQITAFENEKSLAQLQQIVAEKEIASLQLQLRTIEVSKQQQELLELEKETEELQKELSKEQSRQIEGRRLISRYKGELQLEKTMMSCERSVKNACKQLNNTYINCVKHYNILENKLESKKKYLDILKKKEEKVQTKEKYEKRVMSSVGVPKVQNSVQQKTYSQLVRHKNAILLAKK